MIQSAMIRFAASLVFTAALAGAALADARFAQAVEDLPLMSGLEETSEGFAFETARGRIVEVAAAGAVDPADVTLFYAETLPQLGWLAANSDNGLAFVRGGEEMRLTVRTLEDQRAEVRFSITPRD